MGENVTIYNVKFVNAKSLNIYVFHVSDQWEFYVAMSIKILKTYKPVLLTHCSTHIVLSQFTLQQVVHRAHFDQLRRSGRMPFFVFWNF